MPVERIGEGDQGRLALVQHTLELPLEVGAIIRHLGVENLWIGGM